MKKNKMMRIASVLLVAVLLSTCAISGTFAKYITTDSDSDVARVAKWGVTVSVDSADIAFAEKYENAIATTGEAVVSAGADANISDVVAPGTNGKLVEFSISGKPEVKVAVDVNVDLELGEGWKYSDGSNYFPIIIKVDGTPVSYRATDDKGDIERAVEDAISAKITSSTYEANSASLAFEKVVVTWEWPFVDDAANDKDAVNNLTNMKDTYLGNNTAGATIAFSMGITVSQVDGEDSAQNDAGEGQ